MKRDVNCERTVAPLLGFVIKGKRRDVGCFSFPSWPISVGPTLCWVFLRLCTADYHCDPLFSFLRWLLSLPDKRCKTQRWQRVGRPSDWMSSVKQKKEIYIYTLCSFLHCLVLKKFCLISTVFQGTKQFYEKHKKCSKKRNRISRLLMSAGVGFSSMAIR
jgi:hypothetical protein